MENNYYVYAYLDPRRPGIFIYGQYKFDFEPFYIGKGKNNRIFSHINEHQLKIGTNKLKNNKIKKIKTPIIIKVTECLTDYESLELEMILIKLIGRLNTNTGPLTNLTDGGEGGSGRVVSEETKQKMSIKNKGKIPWNIGLTSENSDKIKQYSIKNTNKIRSDTFKQKMSEIAKKRCSSDEYKKTFVKTMSSDSVNNKRAQTKKLMDFSYHNNSNWKDIDINKLTSLFLSVDPFYTYDEIGKFLNCGRGAIAKRIKNLNLSRITQKPRKQVIDQLNDKNPNWKDIDTKLLETLLNQKMKKSEIAKILGISERTLGRKIKFYNL